MQKKIIYGVIICFALWALSNFLTFFLQDYFIFRLDALPKEYTFQITQPYQEVTISRKDGEVHGLLFLQENPKGIVLFFHGNRGNVERWKEVSERFLLRGYSVFIPDYRGYGKSTGKRNEEIFYADALACYGWLNENFPNLPITVYGRSIGSAAATYVAAHAECKRLILETPFYSMKDLFYTYYPFLPRLFFFRYEFPNHTYLDQTKVPVSIIVGKEDGVVPYRCSRKLEQHLKPNDAWMVVEEGSHNDLDQFDEYWRFLDQALVQ